MLWKFHFIFYFFLIYIHFWFFKWPSVALFAISSSHITYAKICSIFFSFSLDEYRRENLLPQAFGRKIFHTPTRKKMLKLRHTDTECAVREFPYSFIHYYIAASMFVVLITKYVTVSYASAFVADTSHDQLGFFHYYASPSVFDEKIQDDCGNCVSLCLKYSFAYICMFNCVNMLYFVHPLCSVDSFGCM